jgi:WD40 repeat protein
MSTSADSYWEYSTVRSDKPQGVGFVQSTFGISRAFLHSSGTWREVEMDALELVQMMGRDGWELVNKTDTPMPNNRLVTEWTLKKRFSTNAVVDVLASVQRRQAGPIIAAIEHGSTQVFASNMPITSSDIYGWERERILEPDEPATCVAFSPDSRLIASGGGTQNSILLWDVSELSHPRRILEGQLKHRIWCVKFSKSGKWLACGEDDSGLGREGCTIRVFRLPNFKLVHTLIGHKGKISDIAFFPGDDVLVSGGRDGTIRFWNLKNGAEIRRLEQKNMVTSISVSPDGQYVVSGDLQQAIRLWDTVFGELLQKWEIRVGLMEAMGVGWTRKLLFLNDSIFISGQDHKYINLWNVQTRCHERKIERTGKTEDLALSPDRQVLAQIDMGGKVTLWYTSSWQNNEMTEKHVVPAVSNGRSSIDFSPDGMFIISAGRAKEIFLWKRSFVRAEAHASLSQHRQAIADYDEADSLDPENYEIRKGRAASLLALGLTSQANEELKTARQLESSHVMFQDYVVLADELYEVGFRTAYTDEEQKFPVNIAKSILYPIGMILIAGIIDLFALSGGGITFMGVLLASFLFVHEITKPRRQWREYEKYRVEIEEAEESKPRFGEFYIQYLATRSRAQMQTLEDETRQLFMGLDL